MTLRYGSTLLDILTSDIKMETFIKLQVVDAVGAGKGFSAKQFFLFHCFQWHLLLFFPLAINKKHFLYAHMPQACGTFMD